MTGSTEKFAKTMLLIESEISERETAAHEWEGASLAYDVGQRDTGDARMARARAAENRADVVALRRHLLGNSNA